MATALKSHRTERTRGKQPKAASVRDQAAHGPDGLDGASAWEEAFVDGAAIPLDLPFGLEPSEVRCPYCAGRCANDGWQGYDEPENLAEFQDFVDRLLDFADEGWDGVDERWDGGSEESRTEGTWGNGGEDGQAMDAWDDGEDAWRKDVETTWKRTKPKTLTARRQGGA